MRYRWIPYLLAVVAALAAWTFWPREKPVVGQSAPLPPAKEVRTVEKVRTEVKVVYVYPKKTKSDLKLPQDVVADPAKSVIATGKLDAEERDYTLSAVMDTNNGESAVYARPDPLPWIGPGRRGVVGLAYGLKNGHSAWQMYAQHDLLQVKALHAGARGTVDTDGEWWAGGYLEYRF